MPPAIQSAIAFANDEEKPETWKKKTQNVVKAAFVELNPVATAFNIPPQEELCNATREHQCNWDAYRSFTRQPDHSEASFREQKLCTKHGIDKIDQYLDV